MAVRTGLASVIKFIHGVGSIICGIINSCVSFSATKAMGELYSKCLYEKWDDIIANKIDLNYVI